MGNCGIVICYSCYYFCIYSYTMYYENLLRANHQLLYQKEQVNYHLHKM